MTRKMLLAITAAMIMTIPGLALAADPPAGQAATPETQTPPPTQVQPPAAQPAPPTPAIEKVNYLSGPPEQLKRLSILLGTWTAKTHTFESAMGPESDYAGKTTYKWQFAGMHLEGIHEYQLAGELTFGRSVWGWDPDRQQYQIVWTNRTFPVSFVYFGTFANDNTIVLFSTFMMQGKAITQKMTYLFSDADNYTMTVENDMSGELKKVMTETGTRAKPAAKKSTAAKKPAGSTTAK